MYVLKHNFHPISLSSPNVAQQVPAGFRSTNTASKFDSCRLQKTMYLFEVKYLARYQARKKSYSNFMKDRVTVC